jgi:hypothetical protein
MCFPSDVRTVPESNFSYCESLEIITFGRNSKLTAIHDWAFAYSPAFHSICIPSLVDRIDPMAFSGTQIRAIQIAEGHRHFRVSGDFVLSFDGRFLILYFGRSSVVELDRDIEVIHRSAFSISREFSAIRFQTNSKLRRIEQSSDSPCYRVCSICIPAFVDAIDGRAFSNSDLREIRIAEGNRHFRVSGGFLLSFDGRLLISYFLRSSNVEIGRDIEVLCKYAFSESVDLSTITFESDSKLRRIESSVFSCCSGLDSICIPVLCG